MPTIDQVESYRKEIEGLVPAESFFAYYDKRQWMIGGRPIFDWKALYRAWNEKERSKKADSPVRTNNVFLRLVQQGRV